MTTATIPANFTLRTPNLLEKFRCEKRFGFIPLYHLLRLSDLAREGIEHSGSYRFADHIYRNEASGTNWFGRWLDRRLLNLPATRAMRSRYERSIDAMDRAFDAHLAGGNSTPFRILTVPCGIPRDVRDFVARVASDDPDLSSRIDYHGIDLDRVVVEAATDFLTASALRAPQIVQGNALETTCYDPRGYHFIASTGLGEFLNDADLQIFYGHVFSALLPGGTFFTSATAFDRKSDALLRPFELHTHYRSRLDLEHLLAAQPWADLEFEPHPSGLQTFVRATKV